MSVYIVLLCLLLPALTLWAIQFHPASERPYRPVEKMRRWRENDTSRP